VKKKTSVKNVFFTEIEICKKSVKMNNICISLVHIMHITKTVAFKFAIDGSPYWFKGAIYNNKSHYNTIYSIFTAKCNSLPRPVLPVERCLYEIDDSSFRTLTTILPCFAYYLTLLII